MSGETLEKEIYEQPSVLEQLLANERRKVEDISDALKGKFEYVLIAARGTSDNAARYAKYLFGIHNRIQVALATPSLYTLYRQPPDLKGAWVIGISQSGESPDIVSVIEEGRRQQRPTLAITNIADSPLAQMADAVICLHAGEECATAATKTYTASLATLALLSCSMQADQHGLEQLLSIPDLVRGILNELKPYTSQVERYQSMEQCSVIGRGYNYATAFEIALKIQELTRTIAEPYSSADFLHGPIAAVQQGNPVIVISPSGFVLEEMKALVLRLVEMKADLLIISDEADLLQNANLPISLPGGIPEWISPMVTVLPGQVLSLALARLKGLDPDYPEGLTKITKTW
jgi:glucosamine--fructose-6-phosphate aminotransferase (isomerizing)